MATMTRLDDILPRPAVTAHTFVLDKEDTCMCGSPRMTGWHVAEPEPRTWDDDAWWNLSVTGGELEAMQFAPLSWLVDGLLRQGSLTILAGPPKSFKSLLALSCSLAVASGGLALGSQRAEQGRAMYISLDDASLARQQRRIRDHLAPGEPIPPLFTLHTSEIGDGSDAAKGLDRYLMIHDDCRLLVIDTLEHIRTERGRNESQYRADVKALANLRWLLNRHPQCAVLALMHTRKSTDDDAISSVGGTHGVTGGADAILRLKGQRGSPRRVLEMVGRDDDDSTLMVEVTRQGLRIVDADCDDAVQLLPPHDRRIYEAIEDLGGSATLSDLGEALPSWSDLRSRLRVLTGAGVIRHSGKTYHV